MEKLTFDKLPEAIEQILRKLSDIEAVLAAKKAEEERYSAIMDVNEAAQFLRLAPSTVYTKVSRAELPAFKSGKRLLFKKSELFEHIHLNKKLSSYELKKEADLRNRQAPVRRRYTY